MAQLPLQELASFKEQLKQYKSGAAAPCAAILQMASGSRKEVPSDQQINTKRLKIASGLGIFRRHDDKEVGGALVCDTAQQCRNNKHFNFLDVQMAKRQARAWQAWFVLRAGGK